MTKVKSHHTVTRLCSINIAHFCWCWLTLTASPRWFIKFLPCKVKLFAHYTLLSHLFVQLFICVGIHSCFILWVIVKHCIIYCTNFSRFDHQELFQLAPEFLWHPTSSHACVCLCVCACVCVCVCVCFKHFFNFWHDKIFQDHLVYMPTHSWSQQFFSRNRWFFLLENVIRNKRTRTSCYCGGIAFQAVSWQNQEIYMYILTSI